MREEDEHQKDDEYIPNRDEDTKILQRSQEVANFISKRIDLICFDYSEGVLRIFR